MFKGDPVVIGANPTVTKPASPATSAKSPLLPSLNAAVQQGLGNVGVGKVVPDGSMALQDWVNALTPKELNKLIPYLKKFNVSKVKLSDYESVKNVLQTDYKTYIETSGNNVDKLIELFKSNAVPKELYSSAAAAKGPKSNGVYQTISQKDPKLIAKLIDDTLLSTIGTRVVDKESRTQLENIVKKMIDAGTTTTSKMDKSGKTTTVSTSGYSDEAASAAVAAQAKILSPVDYKRQQGLDFFDWMQKAESMRGGI